MLDKIAAIFVYPLGMALIGLLIAAIAVLWGARRSGVAAIVCLCAALWAVSTPLMAHWLVRQLESAHPPLPLSSYKPADVVIVLGGALNPPGIGTPADLGEASTGTPSFQNIEGRSCAENSSIRWQCVSGRSHF